MAFGAAADAIAVTTPSSAADAIRLLRKQDGGRAALLLAGDFAPSTPAAEAPHKGRGELRAQPQRTRRQRTTFRRRPRPRPADLMPAIRRLLHNIVVVDTLEAAEATRIHAPRVGPRSPPKATCSAPTSPTAVSAGAPSLLEVQASVDEAAAELEELAVRCEELTATQQSATERRKECAALVEELGTGVAPQSARSRP
ncbi:hypothetical protein ACRAWF_15750 [Streptomyces sp. L7]